MFWFRSKKKRGCSIEAVPSEHKLPAMPKTEALLKSSHPRLSVHDDADIAPEWATPYIDLPLKIE